jgi:anti-anti-sigma factor
MAARESEGLGSQLKYMDLLENVSSPAEPGGWLTLRLRVDMTVVNRDRFREALESFHKAGHVQIRLDLSEIRFIDSSGVGVLAWLHKQLAAAGGTVSIARPNRTIRNILRIVGLDKKIPVEDAPGSDADGGAGEPTAPR